jgi:large conductance mechanosensitive channel
MKTPGWINEFRAFIMRGNVVDLAIGIIIGAAFTTVVSSLVKDIFTPIIGLIVGGRDFSNIFITLSGPHEKTLEAAKAAGAATLNVGLFLNACINFIIIGFAVFWLVKAISLMYRRVEAPPAGPTKTEELLAEIRDELRARRLNTTTAAPLPKGP